MKIRGRVFGRLRNLVLICVGPLLLLAFYVILISKVKGGTGTGAQDMEIASKSPNQIPDHSVERVTPKPELICNFENYVLGQPINQTDPCLVATFKKKMLVSPRPTDTIDHVPFNKAGADKPSNIEKLNWVKKLIIEGSSKDAQFFFVESRAHDGEYSSSTIRLETLFGWNGVLIEPQRMDFQKLLQKRKVWAVNTALCVTPHPGEADLYEDRMMMMTNTSGLTEQKDTQQNKTRVPCIPFYTILEALNVTVVDFLNLNIDGVEVLKTIPFNYVTFKIIAVEHSHIIPGDNSVDQLKDLLKSKGYKFVKTIIGTNESLFLYKPLYEQKLSIVKKLVRI